MSKAIPAKGKIVSDDGLLSLTLERPSDAGTLALQLDAARSSHVQVDGTMYKVLDIRCEDNGAWKVDLERVTA